MNDRPPITSDPYDPSTVAAYSRLTELEIELLRALERADLLVSELSGVDTVRERRLTYRYYEYAAVEAKAAEQAVENLNGARQCL